MVVAFHFEAGKREQHASVFQEAFRFLCLLERLSSSSDLQSRLKSQWARHELDFFMGKRVSASGGPPLIPVLLEDVELPALLRDILYIDMRAQGPGETAPADSGSGSEGTS